MRRYPPDVESQLRLHAQLREWTRSGLLTDGQRALLEPHLAVSVRRTHPFLRLGLAVFTIIAAAAAAGLVFVTIEPRADTAIGAMLLLLGLAAFVAADALIRWFRLYRHGVEEGLAALAVVLGGAGSAFVSAAFAGRGDSVALTAALVTCAAICAAAYVRFGFQYAAVGGMALASLIPLTLDVFNQPARRLLSGALFLASYAVARVAARRRDDSAADDASMVAACGVAGAYLVVNSYATGGWLGIWGQPNAPWFRWASYALCWTIPAFTIWRGVRDRDRRVIRVGVGAAIVTFLTNKLYLGWPRQPWDPMLLGTVLIAVALLVRRWLASGPGGERYGFTPRQILHSDAAALQAASLASVAVHAHVERPAPSEPDPFQGGRSGGGGGGSEF